MFKARVKEKQRFEMQRHISRITGKKVSTLRRIPNVIIALRFVINIALVWFGFGVFFFLLLTKVSCTVLPLECLSDWALTLSWLL